MVLDKNAKKEAIRKRNLKNRLLFLHVERIQMAARDLAAPVLEPEARREKNKKKKEEEDMVWSAKLGEIRNRLTNQKRQAQERWNRFSGTDGEGARGL